MAEITEQEQYQKDYDAAAAALDSAASGVKPAAITEVVTEPATAPVIESKIEAEKPVDELAEMRARLEKAEKSARDSQAWGTKNAQRLADIERERQAQQREASKPAILDSNPELAEAIRYVASDPAPQQRADQKQQEWQGIVNAAHPGIFDASIDPELEKSLMTRLQALGDELQDPLVAIREISAEKIAHTERMLGKRFASESAKSAQKSAMSVPGAGAGGGNKAPADADLEAKNRILNMSPAEFEKERRRVMGY